MASGGSSSSYGPALATVLLVVVHAALAPHGAVLALAAACGAFALWRGGPRALTLLAVAVLAVDAAGYCHTYLAAQRSEAWSQAWVASRVVDLEQRQRQLGKDLLAAADAIAALPETQAGLSEGPPARSALFAALISRARNHYQGRFPQSVALAVYDDHRDTVAWAGRVGSPWSAARLPNQKGTSRRPPTEGILDHDQLFVSEGAVQATLVAVAPIRARDGRLIGQASAELPLAARRQIHNEFLSDLDILSSGDDAIALVYRDITDEEDEATAELPAPAPGATFTRGMLRAPDGLALAAFQVTAPPPSLITSDLRRLYGSATGVLASLWLLVWLHRRTRTTGRLLLPLTIAATGWRALWLLLPLPSSIGSLSSPDIYTAEWVKRLPGILQHLAGSPIDLLLTAAWLAVASACLARLGLRSRAARLPVVGALLADAASLTVIAGTLAWVGDTARQSTLELDQVTLLPRAAAEVALQWALLLVVLAGGAVIMALQAGLTRWPTTSAGRAIRIALWVTIGLVAYVYWPREQYGLPLVPAIVLFALPAAIVLAPQSWWTSRSIGRFTTRAAIVAGLLFAGEVILQPSLIYYGEKDHRRQIEQTDVPLLRSRRTWEEEALAHTRTRIDAMHVLEDLPPGSDRTGIEQLAFAVWSRTELASNGLSSGIEIQDETGAVVSRFALNMPAFAAEPLALPAGDAWRLDWDVLRLISTRSRARHAHRRLTYGGRLYGAIHVYLADDFWNLPFLQGRDPYPTLFRSASPGDRRQRPAHLVVYDSRRDVVFSSAERPPGLTSALTRPLPPPPAGSWRTVAFGNALHYAYFFRDGERTYGVSFARANAAQYAGNIVEAAAGATLVPLAALVLVLLLRSLAGQRALSLSALREAVMSRFSVRLFVAFVMLAALPVAIIDGVMGRFLENRLASETERQALAQAAVAKKAVEDYAFTQLGEGEPRAPVTDTAAAWAANLIRNDLDIFQNGVLTASSKRELYASGLLGQRVSGSVYRSLVLEGEPSVVRTDRIGGFSYLVVCLPVRLDPKEPAVLCIPLALRQREVQAVLQDMHRTINVGSLLFLVLAAVFAGRMARRISGPIRELRAATERIAAGDLQARVSVHSRDELQQLVESFNRMAADLAAQRTALEHSNRLAAWAEMARQVAHEVKNPLTPIQLSAQHLRRVFKDGSADFAEALDTCTTTILEQVRKLREIATEFSAFARPPAVERTQVSLAALVRDALAPYRASLPAGVRLEESLADETPAVSLDKRLFDRALVNLIENALHAVGESGVVHVGVRQEPGRVLVEVTDSGVGIDPTIRDRVFEPFFSTKTSGSGLGLALVKKIVEDHGGGVELESAPARGTRVAIWLPLDRP